MRTRNLPKGTRFEVFKRDAFTCQYCGRKAPDVVLEADHIQPFAKGGTNDLLNLITSCKDCNSGKSDKTLSDNSVIEKQHKQLAELQERKEQIEMMFQWQKGLLELDDHVVEQISQFWSTLVPPFVLSEHGKRSLKKTLKKYSIDEIMGAMRTSADQYVKYEDNKPTQDSVDKAWQYVSRICSVGKTEKDKPYIRDLFYIRGILRRRLSYVNDHLALEILEQAYLANASVESMKEHAKSVKNWSAWRSDMEAFISKYEHVSTDEEDDAEDFEILDTEEFDDADNLVSTSEEVNDENELSQPIDDSANVSTSLEEIVSPNKPWKPFQPSKKNNRSQSKQKRRH